MTLNNNKVNKALRVYSWIIFFIGLLLSFMFGAANLLMGVIIFLGALLICFICVVISNMALTLQEILNELHSINHRKP